MLRGISDLLAQSPSPSNPENFRQRTFRSPLSARRFWERLSIVWLLVSFSIVTPALAQTEDRFQRAERLQAKCADGSSSACGSLGFAYETGDGVTRNERKAVVYYLKACSLAQEGYYSGETFNLEDCYHLAYATYHGMGGLRAHPDIARKLFELSCLGVGPLAALACWDLAGMRQRGEGGPVDNAGAIQALKDAIKRDPDSDTARRAKDVLRRSGIKF